MDASQSKTEKNEAVEKALDGLGLGELTFPEKTGMQPLFYKRFLLEALQEYEPSITCSSRYA